MSKSLRAARVLRPSKEEALADWAAMVRAQREQVERIREGQDQSDFYAPVAAQFRADPTRRDDVVLNSLLELVRPGETWLDVGAGAGRYTLGVARRAARMIAVEPSEGMRAILEETGREFGIDNVEVLDERWPLPQLPRVGVAMITHVGYDIEEMGPFLDALEGAAGRLCVAVLLEHSPPTVFGPLWGPIHGEPPAPLPALHEFVLLQHARGYLPEVRILGDQEWLFETLEEAERAALRRVWVGEGSAKHERLRKLLPQVLEPAPDGGYRWSGQNRIGMVTWEPLHSVGR